MSAWSSITYAWQQIHATLTAEKGEQIYRGGYYAYLMGVIGDYSQHVVSLELYRTQTADQLLEVYRRAIGELFHTTILHEIFLRLKARGFHHSRRRH